MKVSGLWQPAWSCNCLMKKLTIGASYKINEVIRYLVILKLKKGVRARFLDIHRDSYVVDNGLKRRSVCKE